MVWVLLLTWSANLQIVECNALPTLVIMLRSEDTAIHYEAVNSQLRFLAEFAFSLYSLLTDRSRVRCQVGVIGNLVHSSPHIKKEVLLAGALQPVIGLLRYCWPAHCCLFLLTHSFHNIIVCCKVLMGIPLNLYIVKFFLFRKPKRSSFVIGSICSCWFRLQGRLNIIPVSRPKGFTLMCVSCVWYSFLFKS